MTNPSPGTGLKENVASLLCYVLGWITGIIFLIIEPNNKTVKFHAIQSIIIFGAIFIIDIIFFWLPLLTWILGVAAFILWVVLMYKAYQGGTYHFPVAGQIADRFVK